MHVNMTLDTPFYSIGFQWSVGDCTSETSIWIAVPLSFPSDSIYLHTCT